MLAVDVDAALMAARLRRQLPNVPEQAGLNEAAVHLYGKVLDECCTCLTQPSSSSARSQSAPLWKPWNGSPSSPSFQPFT